VTLRRHDLADAVHRKNVLGHGWDALQKGRGKMIFQKRNLIFPNL